MTDPPKRRPSLKPLGEVFQPEPDQVTAELFLIRQKADQLSSKSSAGSIGKERVRRAYSQRDRTA